MDSRLPYESPLSVCSYLHLESCIMQGSNDPAVTPIDNEGYDDPVDDNENWG